MRTRATAILSACATVLASCSEDRSSAPLTPVFDTDVGPILEARCVSCHGGAAPAAGWDATSYLSAIACVQPTGAPATLPANESAPILAALDTAPHVGVLSAADRSILNAWVVADTPDFRNGVHDPNFADPRSSAFHGTTLRSTRWAAMLNPNDPNACGRCHGGAPSTPAGVTSPAPGAPACTSCHDQPGGALACSTCHGSGPVAYPPRDPCFFPGDAANAGAHAAHLQPSTALPAGVACSTCHPLPGNPVIGGLHGDGTVEVVFDPSVVVGEASYDSTTQTCAVYCHDQGGARPRPTWSDTTPMACGDCHGSPPAGHFPGACSNCHAEANATGTALTGGPLHLNGKVDLGNGSGLCGACHGSGDSPWPSTGAHAGHQNPTLTVPLDCTNCHVVPTTILDPVHLDGTVHVTFADLATARGSLPTWDGTQCTNVACHGANLADPAAVPAWNDTSGAQAKCGACHGIPPTQHTASTDCDRADCHGSEVSIDANGAPSITTAGLALHIDGIIESAR
ncbi:MAG: CxxxxCH/CxxCH domain-containing protein [Polyangiaceae bacterium]|jgi:predicted CxxxxCH...CXXCH cytochrome family protein